MRIPYAYLKQQTWLYRRNYPRALQPMLGQALKQSLKTGDAKVAKVRAAELNATFEEIVAKAKRGIVEDTPVAPVEAPVFAKVSPVVGRAKVADLARDYLNERSDQLRHGGFKSVRFSVGLLVSLVIEPTERWLDDVIRNHREEALQRVSTLLQSATETPQGCLVTPGPSRRKVRFRGHQTRAYRFIYAVTRREVLTFEDVVRHRCNNGLCINPDHLEIGTRADNKRDDWEFAAYGVDFDML